MCEFCNLFTGLCNKYKLNVFTFVVYQFMYSFKFTIQEKPAVHFSNYYGS